MENQQTDESTCFCCFMATREDDPKRPEESNKNQDGTRKEEMVYVLSTTEEQKMKWEEQQIRERGEMVARDRKARESYSSTRRDNRRRITDAAP